MLDEAQGKVGALTEVLGGSCVVANLCPAKFACIGCAGNAPDPNKRYQVEAKRKWAQEHAAWATTEGLRAEERQLKVLVQDCDLMLEEMSLIERQRGTRIRASSSAMRDPPHEQRPSRTSSASLAIGALGVQGSRNR